MHPRVDAPHLNQFVSIVEKSREADVEAGKPARRLPIIEWVYQTLFYKLRAVLGLLTYTPSKLAANYDLMQPSTAAKVRRYAMYGMVVIGVAAVLSVGWAFFAYQTDVSPCPGHRIVMLEQATGDPDKLPRIPVHSISPGLMARGDCLVRAATSFLYEHPDEACVCAHQITTAPFWMIAFQTEEGVVGCNDISVVSVNGEMRMITPLPGNTQPVYSILTVKCIDPHGLSKQFTLKDEPSYCVQWCLSL